MKLNPLGGTLGVFSRRLREVFVFCIGVLLPFLVFFSAEILRADIGSVDPDGDGTVASTQTTCGGGGNFDCLDDGVATTSPPATAGDYLTFANNDSDYYTMTSLTGVSSVSQIGVHVYHQDGANMAFYISLWDATETTQYGTEVQFTNSGTALWDTAIFSGLSLTQAQLDGLRVRVRHTRPAGGKTNNSTAYAMYADITYTPAVDVTVSTTGNQQNADVGVDNQYIGGVFAITENTSSRNITSITISETGTVDAQNHINDIELYYELDTTGPSYDCADQSYAGSESQFGTVTASSFDAANGSATFTGSVGITTTAAMCVYVILDVDTNATAAQTLEVQITDPSTEVIGSGSAVVSPGTAVLLPNTTTLEKVNLTQIHYHWRNDDGLENDPGGATSATGGVDDTTFDSLARSVNQRIRIEVSNEGNKTSASTQYRLEYATKVSTCEAATGWTDVGAAGGEWDMAGSASQLVEGNNTNNIAESIGGVTDENITFVGTGGQKETSSQTSGLALTSAQYYEMEYALFASTTASQGTTYCFRVSDAGTPIDSYDIYPEATIAADLFINATGTQVSQVTIPTSNVYNGGGFVITDSSAGAHTITDITITASGTVDYQSDISDVVLFYETDTVSPYDCTGESYNGDETQYGATSTGGFSAAATTTFSGSITVSPTQGICLYVKYDVDTEATDGENFEVRIADASTDVVIGAGSVAPAALVDIDGVTLLAKSNVVQQHYHWRNDDGLENDPGGATSATGGVDDTIFGDMHKNQNYRLRFGVSNEGGASSQSINYRLEWGQKITTCDAIVSWTDVGAATDTFDMSLSANFADGNNTTNIAEAIGGVADEATTFLSSNAAMKESSSQTVGIILPSNNYVDIEYSVKAAVTAPDGGEYCFRLTDAGTPLDNYSIYPEVIIKFSTDYVIQRGVTNISGTTATITAGVDYVAPLSANSAFIRITNTQITGGGPAAGTGGNLNADVVTAYISNPGNITSSITFTRGGTTGDTDVAWEIVEYQGASGGENEMVVRQQSTATYATGGTTVTTGTVSGVLDDNDIAVFITGQYNPDAGRFDYNTGLSTSVWNSGPDTATFTRGEAGADAVITSYAVVEFTGSNWIVQRTADHTYTNSGTTETESISAVNSLSRTFIHAQHRAGSGEDQHGDYGHEAWLSGVGQVSFRLNGSAQTPGSHVSAAWVIENTQSAGSQMVVTRSNGTVSDGGGGLTTTNINIGKTLDDMDITSVFTTSSNSDTGRSFPESIIKVRLISTTQYELAISDDLGDNLYRTEVVEWPTAARKFTQNYYRFYASSTSITPTTPWTCELGPCGENTAITGFDSPISNGDSFRLRMSVQVSNATLPANTDAFKLEFGERITTCSAIGDWKPIGDIGSTTALWRGTSTPVTNGTILPSTLLSVSDVSGTFQEENPSALNPNNVNVLDDVEYDWAIEDNGATEKTDYCFRMLQSDGTLFAGGYNFYPTMRTLGYGAQSQDWRWYDDAENETPSNPLAAATTSPVDIDFDNSIKLRWTLREVNGETGTNVKFKLQFSESSTFSTSTDVAEAGDCGDLSYWCYVNEGGVDNALITTRTLTDADSCIAGSGDGCGTHNESGTTTSTYTHSNGTAAEFSFNLKNTGARVNTVYYFRAYDITNDEPVPLGDGESYASLVTKGGSLVFTMDSISSSTVVEGVTLDIDTTPTTLNFGSVPDSTFWEGAHRFTVDTNGTQGYKLLMMMDGDLQNSLGTKILPITGTNAAPTAWNTGCSSDAASCFGYHTSDDTLESVPTTRFSAFDTFARVSTTTLEEVSFSSQPAANETTDVVFRIFKRILQDSGVYEARMIYITVPIF